jgi:hypothetical protein
MVEGKYDREAGSWLSLAPSLPEEKSGTPEGRKAFSYATYFVKADIREGHEGTSKNTSRGKEVQ